MDSFGLVSMGLDVGRGARQSVASSEYLPANVHHIKIVVVIAERIIELVQDTDRSA